jgi:hypothetical protein
VDTQQVAHVLARSIVDKAAAENQTGKYVPGTVANVWQSEGRPWAYASVHIAGDPPDRMLQAPILSGATLHPGDPVMVVFDPPEGAYVVSGLGPVARPRIKLFRATNLGGIASGVVGTVPFSDTNGTAWEHPNSQLFHDPVGPTPGRVTIPRGYGGLVLCHWGICYSHPSGGAGDCRASLFWNGNFLADSTYVYPPGPADTTVTSSGVFEVSETDYLEVAYLHTTGGTATLAAGAGRTYLSVTWI